MQTAINSIVEILGRKFEKCESPSLRLEKFVNITPKNTTERKEELEAVVKCHNHSRNAFHASWCHVDFPRQKAVYACLKGNLIVNQSGGILENAGLCLDSFHGFPYLPGSAVKGVASLAAFREWEENPTEKLAREIAEVFGFPTGHLDLDKALKGLDDSFKEATFAGKVSFMAGIPTNGCELALDIATPHHPEYYQGKRMKAYDDEAPIPLAFPVVKGNVSGKQEFIFRLLPLRGASDENLNNAQKWLEAALSIHGMGAKTAAGYGWFEIGRDPDVVKKEMELKEKQEAELKALEEKRMAEEAARRAREEAITKAKEQVEAERQQKAAEAAKPFAELPGKNWRDFNAAVTRLFEKNNLSFSDERRRELLEVICNNERLKNKDLQGGQKSLVKWLGEELKKELFQRRGIDENAK